MIYLYVIGYSASWGPVPWVYLSEIFPTRLRAYGVGMGAATQWLFNFVITKITPEAVNHIGWRTFLMFGIFVSQPLRLWDGALINEVHCNGRLRLFLYQGNQGPFARRHGHPVRCRHGGATRGGCRKDFGRRAEGSSSFARECSQELKIWMRICLSVGNNNKLVGHKAGHLPLSSLNRKWKERLLSTLNPAHRLIRSPHNNSRSIIPSFFLTPLAPKHLHHTFSSTTTSSSA